MSATSPSRTVATGIERSQFAAILWLGRTLSRRRWERQSPLLAGFMVLLTVVGVTSIFSALFLGYYVGIVYLPDLSPLWVLLIWDCIVVAFLVWWLAGVLLHLQLGGERFSLTRLMHMPVSPQGAFLLNFLSSQMRVSLGFFLALMLGLSVAHSVVHGVGDGAVLGLLVIASMAMIAALTYQFQSWLGRLMSNKRRRGTVVAVAVIVTVLIANLPALYNRTLDFDTPSTVDSDTPGEAVEAEGSPLAGNLAVTVIAVNVALPPGWLPVGAWTVNRGQYWPAALCFVGMLAIAALSLRRSYRRTLRFLTVGDDGRRRETHREVPVPEERQTLRAVRRSAAPATGRWQGIVDRLLNRLPEHARAVAWSSILLWRRAPQGKMVMLSPILLILLYVVLFSEFGSSDLAAHGSALAFLALVLMMCLTLLTNQFGQDGGGFRTLVLVGAAPREILLGKNLSLAPFAITIGLAALIVLQVMNPVSASHFAAHTVHLVSLYLVGCLVGNAFSIRTPRAMSPSSMSVPNSTAKMFLATFLAMVLFLVMTLPLILALLVERGAEAVGWPIPVFLIFAALELAIVSFVYRKLLRAQARLLAERVEFVLDQVTEPVE